MFSEEDRKVFPYSDGEQDVFGDPEEIYLALSREFAGDLAGVLERCDAAADLEDRREGSEAEKRPPEPVAPHELAQAYADSDEATRELARGVCAAFGVPAHDRATGKGFTVRMCRRLIEDFLSWSVEKKTAPGDSPSASPATAAPASTPPGAPTPAPSTACG